jgi:tRNA dimethylallyltransferase
MGMSIGTAQPDASELARVKHYFINEIPVEESITAAAYEAMALAWLEEIFAKHNYAVVCGGTGLYIKALCEGLDEMPVVDAGTEQQITAQYNEMGLLWLQEEVKRLDPAFYNTGEVANPHRLLRALAFVTATGQSITAFRTGKRKERPFRIVKIGLDLPRETLYARINSRVDQMMALGLEDEVRALLPCRNLKNLNTVGYSELFSYFDGNCTLAEAVDKIKQHSRNYAKRQLTWFRKDAGFVWMNASEPGLVNSILNNIGI